MRRPGLGSAALRITASGWSLLWLGSIPEFLEVWDEPTGYTIPSHIPLPRATIWVVSALMIATAVMLSVGWWKRRRATRSPGVSLVAWVVAILNGIWAALLAWSAVLEQVERSRVDDFYAAGPEVYIEFLLAAVSAVIAIALARDALALSATAPAPAVRRAPRPGRIEIVVRWLLVAACAAILLATVLHVIRWSGDNDTFGWDIVTLPWGPVLVAFTAGLTGILLVRERQWSRDGSAPANAAPWLWAAAALQCFWAVLLCAALLFDPHALRWQVAFGAGGAAPMVVLIAIAIGSAVLLDRDARRLDESTGTPEVPPVLERTAGSAAAE